MSDVPQTIDPLIQRELKEGEQLLWWGQPEVKRRAKSSNNTLQVAAISYGLLAIIALIFIVVIAQLLQEESAYAFLSGIKVPSLMLLGAILVLLIFIGYRAYVTYNQYKKPITALRNTVYGITDQRVLVIVKNTQGFSVNSYTRDNMGQLNRVETGEGWGDITFGKVRQMQSGLRSVLVAEKLVGVPNVRSVEDLLERTFKNVAPTSQQIPPQPEET